MELDRIDRGVYRVSTPMIVTRRMVTSRNWSEARQRLIRMAAKQCEAALERIETNVRRKK
jgi:hypothetical protein